MRLLPKTHDLGWAPYAWTLYLAFFVCMPFLKPETTAKEWLVTIAGAMVFLALYFRGYWAGRRELLWIIAAITLLGVVYWPYNMGAGSFFIYAAAFAGKIEPSKQAFQLMGLIETVIVVEAFVVKVHPFNAFWPIVFVLIIGASNVSFVQHRRANARLRLAHDEIEHLAKVAERERIARDLHDLLGHTLSVIILKSELASKLADRDAERARAEIHEVERISREALAQVRSAVRGYRSGGLRAELDAARATLETAGVATTIDLGNITLPPAQEAVLALAVREAATNIVRHAEAKRCTISLQSADGTTTLVVHDDGRGGSAPSGSGLAGMRERVESLGGTLVRDGRNGTALTITLPAGATITPIASSERNSA